MKIKKYQRPAGVLPSIQRYMIKQGILSLIPKNISIGVAGHAESATEGTSAFFNKDALKNIPELGHEIINSINSKEDERYVNPGNLFLLDRNRQQKAMEKWGYHLVNDNDYGGVSKAVAKINNISNPIPIYQLGEDEIDPSKVKPLQDENGPIITMNRSSGYDAIRNNKSRVIDLPNANYYPQSWYKDENGTIYVRSYDLNDYGSRDKKWRKHVFNKIKRLPEIVSNKLFGENYDTGDSYEYEDKETYGNLQFLANIYDRIGNPFVQRSGIKKASQEDIDIFLNHPIYDVNHNVIGFSGNRIMQKHQGGILKKYQQGGSIKYTKTESQVEIPEIQGYKRQFPIQLPRGEETKTEDKSPQVIYIQQQAPEQPKVEEVAEPVQNEWSDIRSVIKTNEGFVSTAKNMFKEPSASIGYGFFDRLPDGTKITPGMRMSRVQADRQLDIALSKLSSNIQGSLDKYGLQTSPEQFNVLIDLGYHGGAGLVDKLLKESNGDSAKIGSLLLRYATTAKYGDKSIERALKNRALRRSQGWNKYTLKGKNGLKVPKFQLGGITPDIINNTLTNVRQKIADSKWGPKVAQELGIKQKEITLPDGSKVPIIGGIGVMGLLNSEAWEGLEYAEIAKEAIGYNKQIPKIPKWEKTIIGYEGPIKKIRTGEEKHQSFLKGLNTYTKNRYKSEFSRLDPNEQARIENEYRRIINSKR